MSQEKTTEEKQVGYLKALKRAYSWKILEEQLNIRISDIEHELLEQFDPDYNEQLYTKNDLRKVERKLLKDFLELPDNLINALDIIETKEEDND